MSDSKDNLISNSLNENNKPRVFKNTKKNFDWGLIFKKNNEQTKEGNITEQKNGKEIIIKDVEESRKEKSMQSELDLLVKRDKQAILLGETPFPVRPLKRLKPDSKNVKDSLNEISDVENDILQIQKRKEPALKFSNFINQVNFDPPKEEDSGEEFNIDLSDGYEDLEELPLYSCNCKKSRCLKLYCDCIRNNGFCGSKCNCLDCANIKGNKARYKAIQELTFKNPKVFNPIVTRPDNSKVHHKGCYCVKSECLKNYCVCYEYGVACGSNCRCTNCKNVTSKVFYKQKNIKQLQSTNIINIVRQTKNDS